MVSSRFSIFTVVISSLASAVTAVPRPQSSYSEKELFARQGTTTPDGTCGNQNSGAGHGYLCPTTSSRCCSQWGWCGDSADHCGTGCQSSFGSCTSGGGSTPTPTPPSGGGRPHVGNVPYGATIFECTVAGTVALTFDDGPFIYTNDLLNLLDEFNARATFFVNGQNWGAPITDPTNRAVVQRMINDGHQVGSHTWSHPDLSGLSDADVTSQMTQLESALVSIIERYPTYMRPPYFSCGGPCLNVMNTLGYHVINTNLDTLDWQGNIQNSMNIFSNAINPSNPASDNFLVLAHDVHAATVNTLARHMLQTLQSRGYRAVTVGECLGDPAANWYRTA